MSKWKNLNLSLKMLLFKQNNNNIDYLEKADFILKAKIYEF
jgi:hypothetical protein